MLRLLTAFLLSLFFVRCVEAQALKSKLQKDRSVYSVQFSPDGKWLATASESTFTVWNVSSDNLEELRSPPQVKEFAARQAGDVRPVIAFSPDGQFLAGSDGSVVAVWETSKWKKVAGFRVRAPVIRFTHDSTELVGLTGKGIHAELIRWETEQWSEASRFSTRLGGQVSMFVLSPDGMHLVTNRTGELSGDQGIAIWDLETSKVKVALKTKSQVYCLAISPDGKTVASGGKKEVILWQLPNGERVDLPEQPVAIEALTFSPDNQLLLSGGWTRAVKVWNVTTREEVQPKVSMVGQVFAIDVRQDGELAAACSFRGNRFGVGDVVKFFRPAKVGSPAPNP